MWIGRLFGWTGLAFIAWHIGIAFVLERRDVEYVALSLFGTVSGLCRFAVYKVRSLPEPLWRLAWGDAVGRERAFELISAHREALFALANLPASVREPALVDLDREALVERVRRFGHTDWPRVLRWVLAAWAVGLALVLVLVLAHTPEPVVDR